MKKQPRFITILIGALLSGVALQATAANTINPDSAPVRKAPAGRSSSMGQSPTALATSIVVLMARRLIGKWASNDFTGTGFETTKTPFHIKVKDCPASVTTVAVLFDGARNQSDNSLLAINGGASGVAIKLYEHDWSTAVSLGKTSAKQTVTPGTSGGTGSADLEFYADYISTAATVTAGKADGTANFNMIYN